MDEEPAFLSATRVAIVGLGLMGGSLALALRGCCARLVGVDSYPPTLELARQRQVVEEVSADPAEILPGVDLVILATPVRAILNLLEALPRLHPGPAVVLDLGSTKVDVTTAMACLPERFQPLGGHPMCGKESASLANADPNLFRGYPFAFTPLERTPARARALAGQMAQAIGAAPVWLDAETHDRWVAATSHVPYLVSNALACAAPAEAAPMVGPGFRSTARMAVKSPHMMRDVLLTNRANVLRGLQCFRARLEALEERLAEGDECALVELLELGADRQKALTAVRERSNQLTL